MFHLSSNTPDLQCLCTLIFVAPKIKCGLNKNQGENHRCILNVTPDDLVKGLI